MTTTLNQIRSHRPCQDGWAKLLKHLNKSSADDEPLHLSTVLASNGLDDAIWCLRTEATPERIQRFALAVARRTQHLHPQAKATLDIVERYLSGQATKAELNAAHAAAHTAANAAANTAANAAAYPAAYIAYKSYAAANAAANAAAHDAATYAANAALDAAEREAQSQIFKEIFA